MIDFEFNGKLTNNKHLAQLSDYGAFIDYEVITIPSIIEGKNVIVGELAEYIWFLEKSYDTLLQQFKEKEQEVEKLKITRDNAVECADMFKQAISIIEQETIQKVLDLIKKEFSNEKN